MPEEIQTGRNRHAGGDMEESTVCYRSADMGADGSERFVLDGRLTPINHWSSHCAVEIGFSGLCALVPIPEYDFGHRLDTTTSRRALLLMSSHPSLHPRKNLVLQYPA